MQFDHMNRVCNYFINVINYVYRNATIQLFKDILWLRNVEFKPSYQQEKDI